VVAQILLVFKPDQVPDANSLNNKFANSLGRNNANERVLDTYVISTSTGQSSRISGKEINSHCFCCFGRKHL
jgi:hypothetical protein